MIRKRDCGITGSEGASRCTQRSLVYKKNWKIDTCDCVGAFPYL
jgi:hypothetical protein